MAITGTLTRLSGAGRPRIVRWLTRGLVGIVALCAATLLAGAEALQVRPTSRAALATAARLDTPSLASTFDT